MAGRRSPPPMTTVVLALGFDLFFKPRLMDAAKDAGIELRFAGDAAGADRVVADASTPGVIDQLEAIRKTRPDVPILACYPHVDERLAARVKAIGTGVTRGAFNANVGPALAGEWP